MNHSPSEAELQARREEAWARRNAMADHANAERLAAWEARLFLMERDLPQSHTRRISEAQSAPVVLPMKART